MNINFVPFVIYPMLRILNISSHLTDAFSLVGKQRDVGVELVKSLQNTKYSVDEKLEKSNISVFGKKPHISEAPEAVGRDVLLEPVDHYESDIKDEDSDSDEEDDTDDENDPESLGRDIVQPSLKSSTLSFPP